MASSIRSNKRKRDVNHVDSNGDGCHEDVKRRCCGDLISGMLDGTNPRFTIPPITALPNEMINNILSLLDYRSVINSMSINENWRECGRYILNTKSYWKNLCQRNISEENLWFYLHKDKKDDEMIYKRIYLKWSAWQKMKRCMMCRSELDVRKPDPCPAHSMVAAQQERPPNPNYIYKQLRLRGDNFKGKYYSYSDVTIGVYNFGDDQVLCVTVLSTSKQPVYAKVVKESLSADISNFFYYGGMFLVGLRNGEVLVYDVESWEDFDLANFVMKFVGIEGKIRDLTVRERGMRRIIVIGSLKKFYTFAWDFKSWCKF